MSEIHPLLSMLTAAAFTFGPIILFSCWYGMRDDARIAASKPATYRICAPSRSQMMQAKPTYNAESFDRYRQRESRRRKQWAVVNPREIEQHSHQHQLPEQWEVVNPKEIEQHGHQHQLPEQWTVVNPREIEQHGHQHQLPEQSSAAKLTHELFRKARRRRQDA